MADLSLTALIGSASAALGGLGVWILNTKRVDRALGQKLDKELYETWKEASEKQNEALIKSLDGLRDDLNHIGSKIDDRHDTLKDEIQSIKLKLAIMNGELGHND